MVKQYQDLVVWQKAMAVVTEVYKTTAAFPDNEKFGLTSQMRRAAVSIPSNIAEGQGRMSSGEFKQFLGHARGSLYELETQLLICENMELIESQLAEQLQQQTKEVGRLLNGLLRSLN
ncbi:MAG: four helix bundle protein [SAR324 cluster bacterium]|nr:four helix bundle protein [SAR324 cluster bacterium]